MKKMLIYMTCSMLILGLVTTGLSAELLAHYTFEGTLDTVAVDVSGNGYDGTINFAERVDGYQGGGLEFSGSENVTLPAAGMALTSYIGSVSFWMNAAAPTGINTIFWGGDNTTGGGFGPENEMHIHIESQGDYWAGGECSFFVLGDSNAFLFSDPDKGTNPGVTPVNPTILADGTWHHVAAVWNGDEGTATLYIDGIQLDFRDNYYPSSYELSNMFLGQMGGGGRTYNGILDEVHIYSDALTGEDVYAIFEGSVEAINDDAANVANEFVLNQNYPNPFNPTTTISYKLKRTSSVRLEIFDLIGQHVNTLVDDQQAAGSYSVQWDGRDYKGQSVSSGVYLYRLITENQTLTRKLMLTK